MVRISISGIFLWLILTINYAQLIESDQCFSPGAILPEDELMKALYLVDPDPATGYLKITQSNDDPPIQATVVHNELDYISWLAKLHDARQEMTNLWSYITNLIVSNLNELSVHYRVIEQSGQDKPDHIIDFKSLSTLFYNAALKWETVNTTWPYSCFDRNFFTALGRVFNQTQDTFVSNCDTDIPTKTSKYYRESYNDATNLGINNKQRGDVLEQYFNSDILKFIPEAAQSNVFYHSDLIWTYLQKIIEGKTSLDLLTRDFKNYILMKHRAETKCKWFSDMPIGRFYYCQVDRLISLVEKCRTLNDVTPCAYDRLVQDYFSRGRFIKSGEFKVINNIIDLTQQVLSEFQDYLVGHNRSALLSLYSKFKAHITVPDSMCTTDWPKAFNCSNRIGCNSDVKDLEFDCDDGTACRINTLYRFDCLLKFILKSTRIVIDSSSSDSWKAPSVKKSKHDMMIWLSFVSLGRSTSFQPSEIHDVIVTTQESIKEQVENYRTSDLKNFTSTLPPITFAPRSVKDVVCGDVNRYKQQPIFCSLEPLLSDVFLLINLYGNIFSSHTRMINPSVNYPELLTQLQTWIYFKGVTNQFEQNFGELSSYFSSLADYDKSIADSDRSEIATKLLTIKQKIDTVSSTVKDMFKTVVYIAISINSADLAQKASKLSIAIAEAANPLKVLTGNSNLNEIASLVDDLAKSGVTTAKIATLDSKILPELIGKARFLNAGFLENSAQLKGARDLIETSNEEEDATDISRKFLMEYDNYNPKVTRSDISSYGELWITAATQLCEAALSADTAAAVPIEIGLVSTGDCFKLTSHIQELITLYEDYQDYQSNLLDVLSQIARSNLAYRKAKDLKAVYSRGKLDDTFLNTTIVSSLVMSYLNIWKVVAEYCVLLTFNHGGTLPKKCEIALKNPSQNSVSDVISYKPDSSWQTSDDYKTIPVTPKNSSDKAFIDLNKLYKGESVIFKIPDFQWLKDNGWVGPNEEEKAIYITGFDLYLPPMSGNEPHTISVSVIPGLDHYLKPGGVHYMIPLSGYTTKYTENKPNCPHFQRNPYALCSSTNVVQLCVQKSGERNRPVQPSVFTEWNITASISNNQKPSQFKTDFKLQAQIFMREANLDISTRQVRSAGFLEKESKNTFRQTRSADFHCCAGNQYWSVSSCQPCPTGSNKALDGYYCQ